jgi:hypothetical protein
MLLANLHVRTLTHTDEHNTEILVAHARTHTHTQAHSRTQILITNLTKFLLYSLAHSCTRHSYAHATNAHSHTRAHTDNPNGLAIVFFFGNDYVLEFVNEPVLLYVRIMEHICRVCMDVFCVCVCVCVRVCVCVSVRRM